MHWLDDAYGWMTSRPRFYRGGFGEGAALERLAGGFRAFEPPPIKVTLDGEGVVKRGVRVRRGSFESPCAAELPAESRLVRFEWLTPEGGTAPGPVALHLAATGDQGFSQRRTIAMPLVQDGIGALIPENPYYGSRRPHGQRAASLRTVADQLRMNRATVVEALALLRWLKERGHTQLGVTGFSMGGQMAALVGGAWNGPLAVVPCAGPASMAPIFLSGVIGRGVAWDVLAREAGGSAKAREKLRTLLEATSAAQLPPPRRPQAAIIWGALDDGFVPADSVQELSKHWPGVEVRWANTGHVSGYLSQLPSMRAAVRDSFHRLSFCA